jgi:hypothetical protein
MANKKDELEEALLNIKSDVPKPQMNLPDSNLDELIQKLGPKTIKQILKAKKELPVARIPFLFSSLDSQAVIDVLNNNMDAALKRAENKKPAH